jgi:FKBP-type peptidyl-prolyl cis-trans isomerase SlpA
MASTIPTIDSTSFVTLHYRLGGPLGDVVNTFNDKPATLSFGAGQLSPALEQCLLGLGEGVHQTFEVGPGLAFGPRNPEMVQWVSMDLLKKMGDPLEHYNLGDVVTFPTPDGTGTYAGVVRELRGEVGADSGKPSAVLFDFNHPLAGQAVQFEVKIIGVL